MSERNFNPTQESGRKIICECGVQLFVCNHAKHLLTDYHRDKLHKKKVSEELKRKREQDKADIDIRKCDYICDRGIHKGKYLEDVVKFHPQYIHFLITHHRHTFPLEFCKALRECGVIFN